VNCPTDSSWRGDLSSGGPSSSVKSSSKGKTPSPAAKKLAKEVFPGSNILVRGSIPRGMILLIGPPGSGKSVFCKQFIYSGLLKGEPALIVLTDEPPSKLQGHMKNLGLDITPFSSMIRIVDCYSWRAGTESTSDYYVRDMGVVNEVSIAIDKASQGLRNCRFVLDSVTNLTMNCGVEHVSRFLQVLSARISEIGGLGILVLTSGVHSEKFENYLKSICDGVFEMSVGTVEDTLIRKFRIYSLKGVTHSADWIRFRVTDRGIVFEL
jgi:KaiC/GvpD/RAD55 family RecA-like ATPase